MHEEIVRIYHHASERKAIGFKWEVFNYRNVLVSGDYEVQDIQTDVLIDMSVPSISLVELVELLVYCKRKGYKENHYYTSDVEPFQQENEAEMVWFYFNQQYENTLTYSYSSDKIIAIYHLCEFDKFIVMNIEARG